MSVSSAESDRSPSNIEITGRLSSSPPGARAATPLPESMQRPFLEALLATTTDPVFLSSVDGRVLSASRAGTEALGMSPPEIIGKTSEEIGLPPHLIELFDQQRERVVKTGRGLSDTVAADTVRGRRAFEYMMAPIFGSAGQGRPREVVAVLSTFRDVQDRNAAIEALRASEDRFRTIAETLPQLVWITDAQGRIEYLNSRWLEYTGRDFDGVVGAGDWAEILSPEDAQGARREWEMAVLSGLTYEVEYRLRRHDGVYRWFLARGVPVRDAAGQIVRWFGTCTDIQNQKQAAMNDRFLAELAEKLRHVDEPDDLIRRCVEALGRHLHAHRCLHADVDVEHDRLTIRRDYVHRVRAVAGEFVLSHLGPGIVADAGVGHTLVVSDATKDRRIAGAYETAYGALGIRSFVGVPVLHEGRLSALLLVASPSAREWRSDEVALVEVVADRMRLAIQNASLVRESRAAIERQRIFFRDALASVTDGRLRLCFSEQDLPPRLPHIGGEVDLSTPSGVQRLRRSARAAAHRRGFADEALQDVETAVGEAAMNAYVHAGSGAGSIRCHQGTLQVWLVDHGTGISVEDLPRAALEKGFTTAGSLGHGLKLMLMASDRIWLLTGVSGTTVVLEFDRARSVPRWAQLAS